MMIEPGQHIPPELPPPLWPERPKAHVVHRFLERWKRLLIYCAIPGSAAVCLQFSLLGADAMVLGVALATAVFWIGYARLHPLGVNLMLTVCFLFSMASRLGGEIPSFPSLSVALLGVSAAAGVVGARLTRSDADESDFFFLPLMTGVLLLALLITLGVGGGWGVLVGRASRVLAEARLQIQNNLNAAPAADQASKIYQQEYARLIMEHFNLSILTVFSVFWALAMWLAGRLARRFLGRLKGLRSHIMMFQIHHRYIFLLILGLILEIFSSLAKRDTFSYLAWPILGVVGLAGFLAGLGIILFLAAIRRMAGQTQSAFWLTLLGVMMAIPFWYIIAIFGLADTWFDFRKLERLRRQLEAGPGGQKD